MLGMGISLKFSDFKYVFKHPLVLLAGLMGQMILLPMIAFLIASLFPMDPYFKIGIIIIAACPGGATSNLITHLLKGNVALSISLTAVNSIITLITIPLIISLGLFAFNSTGEYLHLPVLDTIFRVFLITVLPVFIGLFINHRKPEFTTKLELPLKIIMPVLLGLVYVFAAFEKDQETTYEAVNIFQQYSILPYVLLLNIAGMTIGLVIAKLFRYGKKIQITFAVEIGIQNSVLAITIASSESFLNNGMMAVPAFYYGLFTFFSAVIFGLVIKRYL